ncbi:unnamed protein product [Paramecium sonneborni]|uniref:Uncharacterized protein n=1 Tax=Paramecium sonneborni TaxID=65129 RepID=A0A8S1M3X7_9CILI|nr:unnamed protein product [Paramecium sonneborni]
MHQNQFVEQGDPQKEFLEAFKELLHFQNSRIPNNNDLMNQNYPQLLYPLILPTEIPNTFIINMGPYYSYLQQSQLNPQAIQEQGVVQKIQQTQFQNHQIIKEEFLDDNKQYKGNYLQKKQQ